VARMPDAPGALGLAPAPELHPFAVAGPFALRVGRALWTFGDARGAPGFERELRAVLATEPRQLLRFAPGAALPGLASLPAAAFEPVRVVRPGRGLEVHSPSARRLALLVPAASGVELGAASLALFPATDLRLHAASALLALVDVRAHEPLRIALAAARAQPALRSLGVSRAHAGHSARLRVAGLASDVRVAYELGEQTALAGAETSLAIIGTPPEPARALVMSRAAGAQLLRTRVPVEARRPPSCSLLPAPGPGRRFGPALLCSWAGLLKIRRRRGVGNRLRPQVRCELRHGAQY